MAFTDIEKLRIEIQDVDITFPILSDETYMYLLEKHSNVISRAAMDAARMALMQLSQRGNETVDIFTIRGTAVAEQYRQALMLYIKDPYNNPVLQNCKGWVGGVFLDEFRANIADYNTNNITLATESEQKPTNSFIF
jgi:hypothetical protein